MQGDMDGHIPGKLDGDHLLTTAFDLELGEPAKEADSMLQVNEWIAVGEFGKVE